MEYQLPSLPYAYDALEPFISSEIMTLHHQGHHQAYVTNLNALMKAYGEADKNQDIATMIRLQSGIKFNGGGHINHSLFWKNLAPKQEGGGLLTPGVFATLLINKYTSFDKFMDLFNAQALAIQGSGWCWLGLHRGELVIMPTSNQDPVSAFDIIPLLGIDVWEHAYYLQYKNARKKYLENIWNVIHWKEVERRYLEVRA